MTNSQKATHRVGAVILAAGESRRMGRCKALLELEGETFLERWLRLLDDAGVQELRVVLGHDAAAVRARVDLSRRHVVINARPERGMLSSFLFGLEALPPVAGAFLCPVDHPRVSAELVRRMTRALRPRAIVLPAWQGRRGHPVLFAAELFDELRGAPPTEGARAVVRADARRIVELEAGPEVLDDVNTPQDYRRVNGR